jgi:hypothetical protein
MLAAACRTGVYAGHRAAVLQMLVLGDNLLSLGRDKQLLVWKIGQYDAPQVRYKQQQQLQQQQWTPSLWGLDAVCAAWQRYTPCNCMRTQQQLRSMSPAAMALHVAAYL